MDLRCQPGAADAAWVVVRARGADALGYLQGQTSQDLSGLGPGATTWTLLLEPTGRLTAWLRVTRTGDDEIVLDAQGDDAGPVLDRLGRFRLRSDVTFEVLDWRAVALRGPGTAARAAGGGSDAAESAGGTAMVLPAGWPGVEGVDLLGPDPQIPPGVERAAPGDLEALRVEAGVPRLGAELDGSTIPAEVGAWMIDASVSFTKGCFTGQELVARIDSRGGRVPRPLRALVLSGERAPAPGADVVAAVTDPGGAPGTGEQVGRVTSTARSAALGPVALAPLARKVAVGAAVLVALDGGWVEAEVRAVPLR